MQNTKLNFQKKIKKYIITTTQLGSGISGSVFLGFLIDDTSKFFAIKKIDTSQKNLSNEHRIMAKNEAELLKKLDHKNIVKLYDEIKIKEEESVFLVFEYCKDGTLAEYLEKAGGKLTERQAINFFLQICAGYYFLYQQKIMHRDIKPQNIFLSDGHVKIGDFGLAKCFPPACTDFGVGSPLYMAPEVYEDENTKNYDNYCDMWSLGIVLFQMLYGKTPWDAENSYQLFEKIKANSLCFPKSSTPPNLRIINFIRKILSYEVNDRPRWESFFKEVEALQHIELEEWQVIDRKIDGQLVERDIKLKEDRIECEQRKKKELIKQWDEEDNRKSKNESETEKKMEFKRDDEKEVEKTYKNFIKKNEEIRKAQNEIGYQKNCVTLLRRTRYLLLECECKHKISISYDVYLQLPFLLEKYALLRLNKLKIVLDEASEFLSNNDSPKRMKILDLIKKKQENFGNEKNSSPSKNLIMNNLANVCSKSFVESQIYIDTVFELKTEYFEFFKIFNENLLSTKEKFEKMEKEENLEKLKKNNKKKPENIENLDFELKNIEFLSVLNDPNRELDPPFFQTYENLIIKFFEEQSFLKEDSVMISIEREILVLFRLMQISRNLEKELKRREDDSQIFFELYEGLEKREKKDLVEEIISNWK